MIRPDDKPAMRPILPGYKIRQQIYESANSLIYRAIRKQGQQAVILKVLKPDYPQPTKLTRYQQEYELTRRVNAAGVIKAYSLEAYHNTLALILEDFGGASLDHWLEEWKNAGTAAFPLSTFLRLAGQIVAGLAQVHLAGIIHRDINPSNIVFNPHSGELKIIDFGLATTLSRETPLLKNPQVLEGTLAYLSPEQTGRMNRMVDYRTDFYSLGVTFYELLTGQLPFEAADAMELVHCHLAKSPVAPHTLNPAIPPVLSAIVLKLLAKAPEDRYQSARGLKHDLDLCEQYWQAEGKIPAFELGRQDRAEHFLIPEKLYGRAGEVEHLLAAFERVASGSAELMLVTGFSGIGKTAVINELHQPIVRQRGYFIKGKFDQFNRNIPFSAFVQAFRDLIGQFLSEGEAQQQQWRSRILSALGENGQVIIDLIPELEWMIGPQPPVPELSGMAAQNRFNLLFQRFIQVFAAPHHPLVIFLDDLQWADLASLKLLRLLLSDTQASYLLLLGAYRDNEVPPTHPLRLTLDEMKKTGAMLNTITLAPLRQSDINQLVADSLGCSLELALPLSKLVYQKTQGNPFFNNQFLKALYEEGLITFNDEVKYWQCDLVQVNAVALTDDVVEFMAIQLQKLPPETQEVLKLAAGIGNQFDLGTLAIVQQQPPAETSAALGQALDEGFVLPQSELHIFSQGNGTGADGVPSAPANIQGLSYRFLHDRVQQAAYSLIPEAQRPIIHLNIGRLLLENTPEQELEERLFEITNQLNGGLGLIADPIERDTLAHLNLRAGRKAKTSTAYSAALDYLTVGLNLLPPDSWQTNYPLTLSLYKELAEVAYLTGNFEQMEQWVGLVLQHAATLLDKVKVYEVQIQADIARNQLKAALQRGLRVLHELGVTFPEQPGQTEIMRAFQEVQLALAGKPIPELLHLPLMTDPVSLAAMRITLSIGAPVYLVAPALFPLLITRQLILSINHGNTATSAYAYANYGMMLCGILGDIETGQAFGQLALNLLSDLQAKEIQARTNFTFYVFVHHWKGAIAETLSPLMDGYHAGLETGDLEFGAYCAAHHLTNAYFCGQELNTLAAEIAVLRTAVHNHHQESPYNYCSSCLQAVFNLLGKSNDPCSLVGEACDETQMLPQYRQTGEISGLHNLLTHKLILSYLFGHYEQAVELAHQSEQYLAGVPGIVAVVLHHFYDSLAGLAVYDRSDPETQAAILQQVDQNQAKLQRWGTAAPMNYQHKFELVEAERCRVRGDRVEAMDGYDRAIAGAKENGYLQEEALANELAAKFYLGWGKEKVALVYLQDAYDGYTRWGAAAKIEQLEQHYAQLLAPRLTVQKGRSVSDHVTRPSTSTTSASLDLITVIKASQTIAGEIDFARLLKQMMRLVLENTGAQRAALILKRDGNWVIEAQGDVDSPDIPVLQALDLRTSAAVSTAVVTHVARTLSSVVLDDAASAAEFSHDPYLRQNEIKSVLCAPLIHQGRLSGIIYLENNLIPKVFTAERLKLLNLLAAQMAISLENALMVDHLKTSIAERKRAEEVLRESEERHRNLFENSPISLWEEDFSLVKEYFDHLRATGVTDFRAFFENQPEAVVHCAGLVKILDVNKAAVALAGAGDKAELLTRLAETLADEALVVFREELIILAEGGQWFESESVYRTLSGEERSIVLNLSVVPGHANSLGKVLVSVLDITERKLAEATLRESEQRFRTIFDSVDDAIFVHDIPTGAILDVNARMCTMYGYTREEALQVRMEDTSLNEPPYTIREIVARIEKAAKEGPQSFEWRAKAKDGHLFWVEVNLRLTPIGGQDRILAVVRDITERKRAEAQLERNLRETRMRYEVSQALAGAETEDEVLDVLIQHAGLYPQACVTICTFHRQGDEFVATLRRANPFESGVVVSPIGTHYYPALHLLPANQPFVLENALTDERVDPASREEIRQSGATSLALVPLTVGNEWLALITVTAKPSGYFDEEKQQLYQTLAEQGAVALHAVRLRETIRASQQRLTLLVQQSPLAVIEWDTGFRVVSWNPAAEQIFGYTAAEALGCPVVDLIVPEAARPLVDQVRRALLAQQGGAYSVNDNLTKAGQIITCEWFNSPLVGVDGRVIGVASLARDITERKRIEAELRTSEARYRALVESQLDLISRYLPDTTLTFVNDAYCQFYGKTREELIGLSYLTMVAPEFHEQALKETENFVKDPKPISGEYLNYRWDGQECWIHWILQGITDENGQVVEIQASGRDITPLKQAEAEILRLNEELEQRVVERTAQLEAANKELEAFSYSVSHDLRAPLRAIDGYTRILVEDYEAVLDAEGKRVCDVIRDRTQRMDQLINDLLAFSRLSRTQMQTAPIDMTGLVTMVFQELTTPEDQVRLDFQLAPLPPALGDPTLIRQVWTNLLANAIKFSTKRERAIIEVNSRQEGGETVYYVRDNGAGFDMQYAGKLFGVFQRLHNEREFAGTGVGLAIVQRIIHRHGGRVWAESELDHGATFTFTLPRKMENSR
ncbi:MAG: PAS domain S-box protein [Anaerolineales bacterium]|nr:PAS domain S-box protein [Anaerolineales bacterium]